MAPRCCHPYFRPWRPLLLLCMASGSRPQASRTLLPFAHYTGQGLALPVLASGACRAPARARHERELALPIRQVARAGHRATLAVDVAGRAHADPGQRVDLDAGLATASGHRRDHRVGHVLWPAGRRRRMPGPGRGRRGRRRPPPPGSRAAAKLHAGASPRVTYGEVLPALDRSGCAARGWPGGRAHPHRSPHHDLDQLGRQPGVHAGVRRGAARR